MKTAAVDLDAASREKRGEVAFAALTIGFTCKSARSTFFELVSTFGVVR
jgi:hypothetical protein